MSIGATRTHDEIFTVSLLLRIRLLCEPRRPARERRTGAASFVDFDPRSSKPMSSAPPRLVRDLVHQNFARRLPVGGYRIRRSNASERSFIASTSARWPSAKPFFSPPQEQVRYKNLPIGQFPKEVLDVTLESAPRPVNDTKYRSPDKVSFGDVASDNPFNVGSVDALLEQL
jgi:hypothetical protein